MYIASCASQTSDILVTYARTVSNTWPFSHICSYSFKHVTF